MARFNEEVPEQKIVAYCNHCHEPFYEGEEVERFEQEIFCDRSCFINYMGVKTEIIVKGKGNL